MKKLAIITAAILTMVSLAACGGNKPAPTTAAPDTTAAPETTTEAAPETTEEVTEAAPGQLAGGWMLNEDENYFQVIPEEPKEALDKALEEFVGSNVVPVAYLASQVVAGTNYAYLCEVTPVVPDGKPSLQVVIVYKDLDGKCEFTSFEDYKLGEINEGDVVVGAAGAWQYFVENRAVALPAEIEKAFEEALNDYTGAGFMPVAYLGSQVVAGANYAILCQETKLISGGETEACLAVVYIYAPLEGKAELTDVSVMDVTLYNK